MRATAAAPTRGVTIGATCKGIMSPTGQTAATTNLANTILLCSYHHRLVHEGAVSIERGGDGRFVFARPDGQRLETVPPVPGGAADRADALLAANREAGLDLDASALSTWRGESMDYNWAIDSLAHREAGGPPGIEEV